MKMGRKKRAGQAGLSTWATGRAPRVLQILFFASLYASAAAALTSCNSDTIVVTPAAKVEGVVLNPDNSPATQAAVQFYQLKGSLPDVQVDSTQSDSTGTFFVSFPRHQSYSTEYVLEVPGYGDTTLYGFAVNNGITVDMVSTALYWLLRNSSAPVSSFSDDQVTTLLADARTAVNANITADLVQVNSTAKNSQLLKAYENILAADTKTMGDFQTDALFNGYNVIGEVPYGALNTQPAIIASVPKINVGNVEETKTFDLSISGIDYDKDYLYYRWTIQEIQANCNATGEIPLGPVEDVHNPKYNYTFAPDYSYASWQNPDATYKIVATASDGGLYDQKVWCIQVGNLERPPQFTSKAPTTGTEDVLWTYTPTTMTPEQSPLAPYAVSLVPGAFPSGMDMCINVAPLGDPPVWNWQDAPAGRPCSNPEEIVWTPNNCESVGPQMVEIQAVDTVGATTYQTFNVMVGEVNTNPSITSSPPGAPSPSGTENILWQYQVTAFDREADPTVVPGVVGGSNTSPYSIPGGRGCADSLTFQLTQGPPSASIDPTNGLITWTPPDKETGIQNFTVTVVDGHGGVATQSFSVNVENMERPSVIAQPASGSTIVADENLYTTTPFTYTFQASDPDLTDERLGRLSLTVSGLPAGATIGAPYLVGGVTGANTAWDMTWSFSDANTPGSWPLTVTVCDSNVTDNPLATYLAPIYAVMTPHQHFCVPESVTLSAPKQNIASVFTSVPPAAVTGTQTLNYNATVTDGNVNPPDNFTWSLVGAPSGMTLTPTSTVAPNASATISWTPNNTSDLGLHNFQVKITDGNSYPGDPHTTTQNVSIFVLEKNQKPTITSTCPTTAQNGTEYTCTVTVNNPNQTSPNNINTFSLSAAPSGMTIDPNTGVISWMPTVAQAKSGSASFTAVVTDGGSPPLSDQNTTNLTMTYVEVPPQFTTVANQTIPIDVPYTLTVSATDPNPFPITLSATGLPTGATFVDNGDGTGTLTWDPTAAASANVTFTAKNTANLSTTMTVQITAVDAPVFLSHPVIAANSNGPYSYEVHCLDPAGGGLTFDLETAPAGMSVVTNPTTHITNVEWNPQASDAGTREVILRATDVNNAQTTQTYNIQVKATTNNPPNVTSTTPSSSGTVDLTEGRSQTFTVNATDPDNDSIHYAWYLDGTWVMDTQSGASSSYTYSPGNTDAGDHTIVTEVYDGAATQTVTFNIHVRDAIPVLGKTFTLASGTMAQFLVLPRAGDLIATTTNPNNMYVFEEANFSGGYQTSATGITFPPGRLVVENDYANPSAFKAFVSEFGDLTAAGNSYNFIQSGTMIPQLCAVNICYPSVFESNYPMAGGTNEAFYVPGSGSTVRFSINPTNREFISSASGGTDNSDIDLGAGSSASTLVMDQADSSPQLYVADTGTDSIKVIDPVALTVTTTISLAAGAHPAALYFNNSSKKLYVYEAGTGSIAEIIGSTNTISSNTSIGFTGPSIPNDPLSIIGSNDSDNLLYLVNSDNNKIITYDINYGSAQVLPVSGASVIYYDPTSKRTFGANFSSNTIFEIK